MQDPLHLLRERGDAPYGEDVSQLAHALQAATLAERRGMSEALVVAALLHDVGHLLEPDDEAARTTRDGRHEQIGARLLARGFGPEVVEPVRLHVAAKRYLARDPDYLRDLSPASRASLALQGGPMSDEDATAFSTRDFADDAIVLRRLDDEAKVVGRATATLDHFRCVVDRLRRSA